VTSSSTASASPTSTVRWSDRLVDVVVYGATGYVGRLIAGHLAAHAPEGARVTLAGRSADRLRAVREGLGERAADWPVVAVDATDERGLADLAASTRVLLTTVGPYAKYGFGVAAACAAAGTHYADLTGEVLFVRQLVDRLDEQAVDTGARLVTACGFDAVPSDLAVLALHEAVERDGAGELADTTMVVRSMRGGFSGGTFASILGQAEEMRSSRKAMRLVLDPYALSPDREAEPDLGPQRDLAKVVGDPAGGWQAPFVMGTFNTRIVRRSNALSGWSYGRTFAYREVMGFKPGPRGLATATGVSATLGAGVALMASGPGRSLLRRIAPDPGKGPSESSRERGSFRIVTTAETTTGARYRATFAAKGDPGYAATSVMIGQAALALALDELPPAAGVLTPATGIGHRLIERLVDAGFTIDVTKL
jgi:short subunit dehydrogenase-like uncharacterized protein